MVTTWSLKPDDISFGQKMSIFVNLSESYSFKTIEEAEWKRFEGRDSRDQRYQHFIFVSREICA